MYLMVALSLVRHLFILHGMLDQHDRPDRHIHTISTNFTIVNHNLTWFNDTNSFHYLHKNL